MRVCIRCGCVMRSGCGLRIKGTAWEVALTNDDTKLFGGRIEPKVAICPNCGEVSIYVDDIEKVRYE